MSQEKCSACEQDFDVEQMIQLPLGNYICKDEQECIARFSGWNKPISEPAMTPIPEDLRCFYASANERPNEYMGSAPFYNRKFAELIERIAKLIAGHNAQFNAAAQLAEGVVRLTAERDALRAESTRLKAPVSDEEIAAFRPWFMPDRVIKDRIELILVSRRANR